MKAIQSVAMTIIIPALLTGFAFLGRTLSPHYVYEWGVDQKIAPMWQIFDTSLNVMLVILGITFLAAIIVQVRTSLHVSEARYGLLPKILRMEILNIRESAYRLGDAPAAEILLEICNNLVKLSYKFNDGTKSTTDLMLSDILHVSEMSKLLTMLSPCESNQPVISKTEQALVEVNRKINEKIAVMERQHSYALEAYADSLLKPTKDG